MLLGTTLGAYELDEQNHAGSGIGDASDSAVYLPHTAIPRPYKLFSLFSPRCALPYPASNCQHMLITVRYIFIFPHITVLHLTAPSTLTHATWRCVTLAYIASRGQRIRSIIHTLLSPITQCALYLTHCVGRLLIVLGDLTTGRHQMVMKEADDKNP